MYTPHLHCRACGYGPKSSAGGIKIGSGDERLIPVFNLGLQPIANDFTTPEEERAGYAPLQVLFCPRCTLGQLSVVVRPEILYRRYSYITSTSNMMAQHFQSLLELVSQHFTSGRLLEIGSNDGLLLDFFRRHNYRVCGIDPAENLASVANQKGLRTITGLFNIQTAQQAAEDGRFDIVLARHVFCHVENWRHFIGDLSFVTHVGSIVGIEAPYVCDMLERGEFDTIYHEHTSYMNLRAIQAALEGSAFKLWSVRRYPIHGGAVLLLLRRKESGIPSDPEVTHLSNMERAGLEAWYEFSQKARDNITALKLFVSEQRQQGKTVVGFGASAKSTVWVNACGFTRKELSFITDNTLQKQWKLCPGSDIPIVDEGAILRELPSYAVCFAWNYRDEILEKNQLARSKGVKFVFPIPSLEVV